MTNGSQQKFFEELTKQSTEKFAKFLKEEELRLKSEGALSQQFDAILKANEHLLVNGANGGETCNGSFAYASAFIWSTLYTNPTLNFANGISLEFYGTSWGAGLGAAKMWVAGHSTIPPIQLLGQIDYELHFLAAVTEIMFSRNGVRLVHVLGAGLGIGTGLFKGSGEFKRA